MELNLVKENEDGSADYTIVMSQKEQEQLIQFAVVELLKRGIEQDEQR